jgi:hypothetical protein
MSAAGRGRFPKRLAGRTESSHPVLPGCAEHPQQEVVEANVPGVLPGQTQQQHVRCRRRAHARRRFPAPRPRPARRWVRITIISLLCSRLCCRISSTTSPVRTIDATRILSDASPSATRSARRMCFHIPFVRRATGSATFDWAVPSSGTRGCANITRPTVRRAPWGLLCSSHACPAG